MAIQAFGKLIEEDEEAVYYKFGSQSDMLDGIAKIKKSTFELIIVKNIEGKLGNYLICKLAAKIIKKGVNDIPSFLYDILSTNLIAIGTNEKGLFADYIFNGNKYRIAYGTNGYIVSFFPVK